MRSCTSRVLMRLYRVKDLRLETASHPSWRCLLKNICGCKLYMDHITGDNNCRDGNLASSTAAFDALLGARVVSSMQMEIPVMVDIVGLCPSIVHFGQTIIDKLL